MRAPSWPALHDWAGRRCVRWGPCCLYQLFPTSIRSAPVPTSDIQRLCHVGLGFCTPTKRAFFIVLSLCEPASQGAVNHNHPQAGGRWRHGLELARDKGRGRRLRVGDYKISHFIAQSIKGVLCDIAQEARIWIAAKHVQYEIRSRGRD